MHYVLATLGIGLILVLTVKLFGKSKPKIKDKSNRDFLVDGKDSENILHNRK